MVLMKEFYTDAYSEEHSFYDTLKLQQNPLYKFIKEPSPNLFFQRTEIYIENDPYSHIMDWFICYSVLIFSIIESIFNFQRYYMAKCTTQTFENPNAKLMISEFSIYACTFSVLFMLQIHFYFWLFPIVFTIHCVFNLYVTLAFNQILTERYTFFSSNTEEDNNNNNHILDSFHEEIMHTVSLIQGSSLLSTKLSSFYILLFCIAYDVHIVIYIPLIWSASNIAALFNFVRNRTWLKRTLYIYCPNRTKWKQHIVQLSHAIVDSTPKDVPIDEDIPKKVSLELIDIGTLSPMKKNNSLEIMDNYSTCTNSGRTLVRLEIPSLADQNYKMSDHTSATTDLSNISNQTTPNTANEDVTPQKTPDGHLDYPKWSAQQTSNSNVPMLSNQQTSSLKISVTNIPPKKPKKRFKALEVFGIDTTPLASDNEEKAAYDMSPILMNANENKLVELVDMSATTSPNLIDFEQDKTPNSISASSKMLVDLGHLEHASSMVKSKSSNDTRPMDIVKSPEMKSRARSYSDPTKQNMKATIMGKMDEDDDEKYSSKDSSLVLELGVASNQSAPPAIIENKLSHPYNYHKRKSNSYDPYHTKKQNDVLLSVMVSHGFCSRSSLKSVKHLKSYIQG